jgi:hypothetical protein
MASQPKEYKLLNNLGPGCTLVWDHQRWGGSKLTTTKLITEGINSVENMSDEATKEDANSGGDPDTLLKKLSTKVTKWDNGYALVVEEYQQPAHFASVYKMRPYTTSIDWYTDDPYEGEVVASIPTSDVDFSAGHHRREVLIWRLEVALWQPLNPLTNGNASLRPYIDTVNAIQYNWWFSTDEFSFSKHCVRMMAPSMEYFRMSAFENRFKGHYIFDIREDGWYRQVKTTSGVYYRVLQYPAMLWPDLDFPDPQDPT